MTETTNPQPDLDDQLCTSEYPGDDMFVGQLCEHQHGHDGDHEHVAVIAGTSYSRPCAVGAAPRTDREEASMTKPYRLLVTGSRDWDDTDRVWLELGNAVSTVDIDREIVIVHGDCPRGADALADQWARKYGATIERHPANWQLEGKRAGFIRNARMVNLGADLCVAFIRNGSRGASHTAALAERAGIPTRRWTA